MSKNITKEIAMESARGFISKYENVVVNYKEQEAMCMATAIECAKIACKKVIDVQPDNVKHFELVLECLEQDFD